MARPARFRASLNITGDLVACVVMDRWTKSETPRAEEMREAARTEFLQEVKNEDVVISS